MKRLVTLLVLVLTAAPLIGCGKNSAELIADCQTRIKESLKDPYSYRQIDKTVSHYDDPMSQAKKWSTDYLTLRPEKYKYMIPPHDGYVSIEYTAKNGFGGSVRNDFSCMYLKDNPVRLNGRDVMEVNDDLTLSFPR